MILHNKSRFILLCLLTISIAASSQDTTSGVVLNIKLDSLEDEMMKSVNEAVEMLRKETLELSRKYEADLDSLKSILFEREREIESLESYQSELGKNFSANSRDIVTNKNKIQEGHKRYLIFLFLSLGLLLILIALSVIYFIISVRKHRADTEKKINALKRYTHSELEGTREELLKGLKKRIKKITAVRLNSKNKSKKKSGKNKKDKR